MDDLISRQATLKAIKNCESGESFEYNEGLIVAMNAVVDVPSAQEWIPITTRPMTEDERQEWSEKLGYDIEGDDAKLYGNLPDDGQRVLVYYKYSGEVRIDTYSDDDGCHFEDNGDMDGITHWMPLPEKPKEEEK